MINKITLFTAIALLAVSVTSLLSNSNFAFSYSTGSQGPGYSASPGDGSTSCATGGCHTGSSTVTGWISSNIPGTGYVPNTAYTITLTMTGSAHAFELTSEKSGGTKVGTFSSASGVTLYNSSKSVVANMMFTIKTLTWTAPTTGNGPVTFYACFASGQSNAKKCTYTESESTIGIYETSVNAIFNIYPNPASDKLTIILPDITGVTMKIYDIQGQFISEQIPDRKTLEINISNLEKGAYIIKVESQERTSIMRFIKG